MFLFIKFNKNQNKSQSQKKKRYSRFKMRNTIKCNALNTNKISVVLWSETFNFFHAIIYKIHSLHYTVNMFTMA